MTQEETIKDKARQLRNLKAVLKVRDKEIARLNHKLHYYGSVFTDYQEQVNKLETKVIVLQKKSIDNEVI